MRWLRFLLAPAGRQAAWRIIACAVLGTALYLSALVSSTQAWFYRDVACGGIAISMAEYRPSIWLDDVEAAHLEDGAEDRLNGGETYVLTIRNDGTGRGYSTICLRVGESYVEGVTGTLEPGERVCIPITVLGTGTEAALRIVSQWGASPEGLETAEEFTVGIPEETEDPLGASGTEMTEGEPEDPLEAGSAV